LAAQAKKMDDLLANRLFFTTYKFDQSSQTFGGKNSLSPPFFSRDAHSAFFKVLAHRLSLSFFILLFVSESEAFHTSLYEKFPPTLALSSPKPALIFTGKFSSAGRAPEMAGLDEYHIGAAHRA
jgi:hypothetical protein